MDILSWRAIFQSFSINFFTYGFPVGTPLPLILQLLPLLFDLLFKFDRPTIQQTSLASDLPNKAVTFKMLSITESLCLLIFDF